MILDDITEVPSGEEGVASNYGNDISTRDISGEFTSVKRVTPRCGFAGMFIVIQNKAFFK